MKISRAVLMVVTLGSVAGLSAAAAAADLKFPEEQKAWEAIAARFATQPEATVQGKVTSLGVTGLKGDPNSKATCAVRVDGATGHVTEVVSNGAKFTDDEMALFAPFAELTAVTLWHNAAPFTGTGVAHLKDLKKLQKLTLAGGGLNDEGLAAIARLPQVRELRAWHCRFTDAGIAALRGHPSLEAVTIGPMWEKTLTDASLESLSHVPRLKSVGFWETRLTWEGGLKHLIARKDTLASLDFGNSLIDPADLERLAKELPGVKVTSKGLAAAGVDFQKAWTRSKAEKWIPKELIDRAIAEAAKNPPATK